MSFFQITENVKDNGKDLLYKNNPVAFAIDETTIFVSSANGNDSTGIKGRKDRPFKTYRKVVEILSAGDKVWFLPGNYAAGGMQSDRADVSFYLQSATLTGDVAMQGGNFTITSDGTGIVTGSIGYVGIDHSKTYYVRNLRRCGLLRGTFYVDGIHELHTMSDVATYYIKNVQRLTATLHTVAELVNVQEIVPQNKLTWARNTIIRHCRFFTAAVDTSNITFGTNNLGINEVVFNDCEFVSTQSYNFQANGEDIINNYIKFINCRFISGAAYHLDMVLNASFPNTKLHLTFIGCDIQKVPFVKGGITSTSIDFRLTPNLTDNNSDLLYKGLGIATVVNQGNVVYVSKNGNDATGLQGRIDRPFLTIQGAINSNLGQTVIVLGGTYLEQITVGVYDHVCTRLSLWFGARIESDKTYTVMPGHFGFMIDAQFTYHYPSINAGSAIVNTNVDGVCLRRGGNPGNVSIQLENITLDSRGTGLPASCVFFVNGLVATHCNFYAANKIFKGDYATIVDAYMQNCYFQSQNLIADMAGYDSLVGSFINCRFSSANGITNGNQNGRSLIFKGCTITTTVGHVYHSNPAYNGVCPIVFEECTLKSVGKTITGNHTGFVEIVNSKIISTTLSPIDVNLLIATGKFEIRNSKLIAQSAQTHAIFNSNATNKGISLINVSMNKPHNVNCAGIIHNVLIEDTLTA